MANGALTEVKKTERVDDVDDEHRMLSADDILAADDLEVLEVYVPEWKGVVRLRVMTADQSIKFNAILQDAQTKKSAWVRIFAFCCVDADGKRMFSDQQVEQLRAKSTQVFLRMQDILMKLNGFTKEATEEIKND